MTTLLFFNNGIDGLILMILAFVFAFVLYFIPFIVAFIRNHRNANAIAVLNVFLGWTFIGWVVALVWAFTNQGKK